MDPNACLIIILRKLAAGDSSVAENLSDLSEWIGNGGFLPTELAHGLLSMGKIATNDERDDTRD